MVGEPPGGVLVQRRIADGTDTYAQLVTDGGELWRRSTVRADATGGELRFAHVDDPVWERIGALTPGELEELRGAVAAATDPAAVPDTVEPPDGAVIGGSDETWTLAGRTVDVRGAVSAEPSAPALARVAHVLDAAAARLATS